jgi:formamidase
MITPGLKGGHEVTKPIYVEGAEVGDAIVMKIISMKVTSIAASSGNDLPVEGRFFGDPFVASKYPVCEQLNPDTVIKGIGQEAVEESEYGDYLKLFNK